ncbi:MAG: hypothetical protein LBR12_06785, partial [Opitutaceae bacterium]|nr:hypothetical protein [Opitutaceae bacterium]
MKKTPAALRFPFAVLATVPFFCRAVDSINDPILTPAFLQTAVAADRLQNALGTLAVDAARAANGTLYPNGTPITGGFGGYHPALDNPFGNATTGCDSLEPELAPETGAPLSIREYLVQNIVVDRDTDQPIHTGGLAAYSPLSYNATLHTVRKPRPGDLIPYVGSTYTPDGAWNLGPGQHQRRFTIDFPVSATDAGVSYPVVLGIRDQSPTNNTANYNSLGEKDGLSFIALFPDYAAYVGSFAYGQEKYSFSYGPGIAHPDILGARRFARGSYPNPVPKLGSLWYANFLLKSYAISEEEMADSPDTRQGNLVPQFQAGKRILYSYGKRGQQTPPLDTIVVFAGLNRTNRLGDAPLVDNESTGCERIYLTREFGYACRWELWANENDKRVALTPSADSAGHYPGHPTAPALAVEWWQRNEGGLPADMSGNYTAHFRAGPVQEIILERDPVTNEPTAGYYTHTQTIINPDTDAEETLNWYLIGVHDMTDVHDLVAETGAP